MLRRVARVLRIGFAVLGIVLLICLPLTFLYGVGAQASLGKMHTGISLEWGAAEFVYLHVDFAAGSPGFSYKRAEPNPFMRGQLWLWPGLLTEDSPGLYVVGVAIPLWLLAFICLAWPVTSFIIARRKRRRGFPVEPANSLACPSAPEKL